MVKNSTEYTSQDLLSSGEGMAVGDPVVGGCKVVVWEGEVGMAGGSVE